MRRLTSQLCVPALFALLCSACQHQAPRAMTDVEGRSEADSGDATQREAAALPLTIGVNPTGLEDPSQFEPLNPGDALNIEFGFQGLWMVVLALRSDTPVEGLVTIFAQVRTDAGVIGEFSIPKQVIFQAEDGFSYYLNLFLVVTGPEHAGERAQVTLEVANQERLLLRQEVEVILTGGDVPFVEDVMPPQLFPDAATEDAAPGPSLDINESRASDT